MIDQSSKPEPPSSGYEVFHSDELAGKILPEGSMYHDGYVGRWVASLYVGSNPVPWSWYAIPEWRMIDECDDVLPEGWQYRMRGESEWRSGSRLAIGECPANLQQCEYRAPTLPREAKALEDAGQTVKRTLWVKASERQPPAGKRVATRVAGGVWCGTSTSITGGCLPGSIEWNDIDAAEAIEAERDRLAKENEELRADNAFLNEAIDAAIKDRDHFEAEADRLRNEVARLQNYSDYQGKEVKRLRDELATRDSRRARARIAELEREIAPRKSACAADTLNDHCVNCQLFDGCNLAAGGNGACHRYPEPRGVGNPEAHWCGEFRPKLEFNIKDVLERDVDNRKPEISIGEY